MCVHGLAVCVCVGGGGGGGGGVVRTLLVTETRYRLYIDGVDCLCSRYTLRM